MIPAFHPRPLCGAVRRAARGSVGPAGGDEMRAAPGQRRSISKSRRRREAQGRDQERDVYTASMGECAEVVRAMRDGGHGDGSTGGSSSAAYNTLKMWTQPPARRSPPRRVPAADAAGDEAAAAALLDEVAPYLARARDLGDPRSVRVDVLRAVSAWHATAAGSVGVAGYAAAVQAVAAVGAASAAEKLLAEYEASARPAAAAVRTRTEGAPPPAQRGRNHGRGDGPAGEEEEANAAGRVDAAGAGGERGHLSVGEGDGKRVYRAILTHGHFYERDLPFVLRVERAMINAGHAHTRDTLTQMLLYLARVDARRELGPRRAVLLAEHGRRLHAQAHTALVASAPSVPEARRAFKAMAEQNIPMPPVVYATLLLTCARVQPKTAAREVAFVHADLPTEMRENTPVQIIDASLYCYLVAGSHGSLVAYFDAQFELGAPLTIRTHAYVVRSHAARVQAVGDAHYRGAEAAFRRSWAQHRMRPLKGNPAFLFEALLEVYHSTASLRPARQLVELMLQERVAVTLRVRELLADTYKAAGFEAPTTVAGTAHQLSPEERAQKLDAMCAALLA